MIVLRLLHKNLQSKLSYLILAAAASVLLLNRSGLAAEGTVNVIHWGHMTMGLFGGLALFLFGMEQMSDALKSALGDHRIS